MMISAKPATSTSPWRRIFEDVRRAVGNRRDEHGVVGSINWLRNQMQLRGANPNVVRNIIYRDKGKPSDKRALLEILSKVWADSGQPPLYAPELEPLLTPGLSAEQEVMQLLGRDKRRVYRGFVGSVRGDQRPKLLLTGRPGSGKTLLTDYIQQALVTDAAGSVIRLELSGNDLAASLARMARALGVADEIFEAKLVKIGTRGAYAVQADAQADVARLILEALKSSAAPLILLLHISQSLGGQESLGLAPLRLNTPEVPRVSANEWLWVSLLEPMSQLSHLSLLISMIELPARVLSHSGFEPPVKLLAPSASEARRFVKVCLPNLTPRQQEALVQRAGRSFEELRTLTLLAEIREPLELISHRVGESEHHVEQLGQLLETGNMRLRDFLAALAVVSLPEFPGFQEGALTSLRKAPWRNLSSLEQAFLDSPPGEGAQRRCFSRQLLRQLRQHLSDGEPERYRQLHLAASRYYQSGAEEDPKGEAASRYLHHLFEARDWPALEHWLECHGIQQSLLRRLWQAATEELPEGSDLEVVALQVAATYVKLGSYDHPDASSALAVLATSANPEVRAWTTLKRAEGAVRKGHFTQADALLEHWPKVSDPTLNAEVELVRASIARWRSHLDDAAKLVADGARPELPRISASSATGNLVHAKVAVWAGLIAKDQGDLERALRDFDTVETDDDLIRARVAFQKGDVQMRLGRFGAALAELDEAVRLSHSSEAPAFEQARYLARRGTLRCRRGDTSSSADFAAALSFLQEGSASERNFEQAKVDDERASNLLALGHFDEAIATLQRNLLAFARYRDEHQVDASFRLLRSRLRLSLAYFCRGLGRPWRLPPGTPGRLESPDSRHAETLIRDVLADIEGHPEGRGRYGPLHRQVLLAFSLIASDPQEAVARAEASLEQARFPYQQARSRAHLAAARLRAGDAEEALRQIELAHGALKTLQSDPAGGDSGLLAWLTELTTAAWVRLGSVERAGESLLRALEAPHLGPYHEALLRGFGEAVEDTLEAGWLNYPPLRRRLDLANQGSVRLPDALLACWQALSQAEAV